MSDSKPWLPRFTADDFVLTDYSADRFAAMVNKRLDEFEATCRIEKSLDKYGDEAECLCTPTRTIDKRVRIEEILDALRGKVGTDAAKSMSDTIGFQAKLAERIEREGIINEHE